MSMRGQSREAQAGDELLAEIEAVANEFLAAHPENPGRALAERIRLHYAGQQLYIRIGGSEEKRRRNAAIYDAFTGDNIPELVARFRLSFNTIYKIIRTERTGRRLPRAPLDDTK